MECYRGQQPPEPPQLPSDDMMKQVARAARAKTRQGDAAKVTQIISIQVAEELERRMTEIIKELRVVERGELGWVILYCTVL